MLSSLWSYWYGVEEVQTNEDAQELQLIPMVPTGSKVLVVGRKHDLIASLVTRLVPEAPIFSDLHQDPPGFAEISFDTPPKPGLVLQDPIGQPGKEAVSKCFQLKDHTIVVTHQVTSQLSAKHVVGLDYAIILKGPKDQVFENRFLNKQQVQHFHTLLKTLPPKGAVMVDLKTKTLKSMVPH